MQGPPQWQPMASPAAPRTRGFFLASFIILGILGNVGLCASNLLAGAATSRLARDAASSMDPSGARGLDHLSTLFHLLALGGLANVVFLTGAWMWKKWGVYGYGCFLGFSVLVGLKASPITGVMSLVGGAMIGLAVSSRWQHFE